MLRRLNHSKKIFNSNASYIYLFIIILTVIGILVARDYGKSWDEYVHIVYAEQTIETYEGIRETDDTLFSLRYYGPFYSVFVETLKGVLNRISSDWFVDDARHFAYFLSFILSVGCLYAVCLRFVGKLPAIAATILFASQPILFGHAFINPKDTPFMAFFLASITCGMYLADSLSKTHVIRDADTENGEIAGRLAVKSIVKTWRSSRRWMRVLTVGLLLLLLLILIEFFVLNLTIHPIERLLIQAYQGKAWAPINKLFQAFAGDAYKTSLDLYISKLHSAYYRYRWLIAALIAALIIIVQRLIFKGTRYKSFWILLGSGFVLGLCTSIRIQGLFSGVLVTILLLVKLRKKNLLPAIIYWGIGLAITYLAWPFLWEETFNRFVETIKLTDSFGWVGEVLYQGTIFLSNNTPWHYIPFLMLVQITLPAMFAGVVGLVGVFIRTKSSRRIGIETSIILGWFLIPIIYSTLPERNFYDNFRLLLFTLPPLFVLGSIGIDFLINHFDNRLIRFVVIAILAAPGIAGIIRLHPYEYTYYNAIVGGTSGAFRQYELDYWCTSSREAIEFVNEVAPFRALVGTNKDSDQIKSFAREDLQFVGNIVKESRAREVMPDFMIICMRANLDLTFLSEEKLITEVDHDGVPLSIIREVR